MVFEIVNEKSKLCDVCGEKHVKGEALDHREREFFYPNKLGKFMATLMIILIVILVVVFGWYILG
ncbi:MAG TPA: hypothetical protein HA230_05275 [Candidatus Aenigmarchaeota archaeon]|nr:hypothetical protein [Candidatus Aenigmarchaeota archaeon]